MKRGLVSWDKSELPPEELAARLSAVHSLARDSGVDALVVYSDVWRSNDARFVSNYMPYWNRALLVAAPGEKPLLLCSLSPRVYPWIKAVTVHETILASPSPSGTLLKLAAERGWRRIGVCDLDGLPADLHQELAAGKPELIDIPRDRIRPMPSAVEVRMHARAARAAREALESELAGAGAVTDHQLTGRLERLLRRAGAEDVIILISNGEGPPVPACGTALGRHASVLVAMEYNGHWAKVTRNVARVTSHLSAPAGVTEVRETLSGPCSWETAVDAAAPAVVSLQLQIPAGDRYYYYGDTCLQGPEGLRVL